jgi:hypothetical protein
MAFLQPAHNTRQRQGSLSLSSEISGIEADNSENDIIEDDAIQEDDGLPDLNELPSLDSTELDCWQQRIRLGKMGHFTLTAPTVEDASALFIDLLKSLLMGIPANQYSPSSPNGLHCRITDPEALLNFAPRPFHM